MRFYFVGISCFFLLFSSCQSDQKQSGGPIIFGDSSTIVTETDSTFLRDFVDDIQLRTASYDTLLPPRRNDSTHSDAAPMTEGKGLKVPFKEVTIFIAGIEARSLQAQNFESASGASFLLTAGDLNGKSIQFRGAEILDVEQRYKTVVLAKNDGNTLQLESLGTLTEWKSLKGQRGQFTISGLSPSELAHDNASAAGIRNAVQDAARKRRLSQSATRKWLDELKKARIGSKPPLQVVVRSVMWRIRGKSANGRLFHKQLRIDIPIDPQ